MITLYSQKKVTDKLQAQLYKDTYFHQIKTEAKGSHDVTLALKISTLKEAYAHVND